MTDSAKPKKMNVRAFVEQRIDGLLEGEELEAKIRECVEGMVMEILSEQNATGDGGGLDEDAVRAIVATEIHAGRDLEIAGGGDGGVDEATVRAIVGEAVAAAGSAGGGGGDGGLSMNQIRRVVAEMIEAMVGDLDATQITPPDAVRAIVQDEIAAHGGLPEPGGGGGGLDEEAVKAIVQNELVGVPLGGESQGGGDGLGSTDVQAIVTARLKDEADTLITKVRQSVTSFMAHAHERLLEGDELATRIAAAAAGLEGGGGVDEHAVREIVGATIVDYLPSGGLDTFVTRDEVLNVIAESGGGGGAVGMDPDEVRAIAREIVVAVAPTRDEVDQLVTSAVAGGAGAAGGDGDGGITLADVQTVVGEALAAMGDGGGGVSPEDVRAIVDEALETAGDGGGGDGVSIADVRAVVGEALAAVGDGGGGGGVSLEDVRAIVAGEIAASGGGGGGGAGEIGVEEFLNSDAMKEALEDRFRLMQTYIKTDLVPKLVEKALKNA